MHGEGGLRHEFSLICETCNCEGNFIFMELTKDICTVYESR